ncbi:DUF4085 family protein [Blastopirellula marina]|uniref:Uncharacterized protein n=1 Tax=Blastopirellula marina TaxID=124 RepID=A0A2S8F4N4_9BACT|nr:DUF4085 family protein [Blastopirellula marina]PQO27113.1 hypothetical protein C5Y98_28090 [Blastopirellula marina]PTL41260.1 DUF4085 domain-containing protein [Blastopirellula marina]
MKYFTLKWWMGLQEGRGVDPIEDFQEHVTSIQDALPQDFRELLESVSLHDAHLRRMEYDAAAQALEMQLDGCSEQGQRRKITLRYLQVESFLSTAHPKLGLPGPFGYGDLGYDEPYVLAGGRFEHRILFSSGIELRIRFGDFQLVV